EMHCRLPESYEPVKIASLFAIVKMRRHAATRMIPGLTEEIPRGNKNRPEANGTYLRPALLTACDRSIPPPPSVV
ncbi:MAG: hypothetical protein V3T17_04395, partial [Pseudomonadales bacterium]